MTTAHAPVPALVTSLARAGWGDLAGREWQGVRTVLRALVDSLPHRSGEGFVTEPQVAQRAGLSLRWTRRCLHVLEDLGVIVQWRRGGVIAGRPAPSWLRLSKRLLVALIEAARPLREAANAARRAQTLARLAGLANVRRKRRSGHAALSADLPTPQGESPGDSPPPVDKSTPCEHGEPRGRRYCALCRRADRP